MKSESSVVVRILGILCIFYWIGDFIINAFIPHNYSWLLWYSSAGLLSTGIALATENTALIYSLFCALFVPETVWLFNFLVLFFWRKNIFGITLYTHAVDYTKKDFYLTLYHFLIPVCLFYGVKHAKKIYQSGWIGASIFAGIILFLTYFLVSPTRQVNCIESFAKCHTVFAFLYNIPNPERVLVALFGMTVFVYIPTSFAVVVVKKRTQHKNT